MKRTVDLTLAAATLLVLGFLTVVYSRDLPLGVVGEWEWPRINQEPAIVGLLIASAGVIVYGALAAAGYRALGGDGRSVAREARWVAALTVSAVALQVLIPVGAPGIFGLTKWSYVHFLKGATGYYDVARDEAAADPWGFLAEYPNWIKTQESNHIGAHPPGLVAAYAGLTALMERHGGVAGLLNAATPPAVVEGFSRAEMDAVDRPAIPPSHRAAVYLMSLLTLLACAGATVPLYLLARESLSPQSAWVSAAFWAPAPALNLFQPLSDTVYPLLSASALALAAWSARLSGRSDRSAWGPAALAMLSGAVMAAGMMFSLAFLPVGVIVALVVLTTRAVPFARRLRVIAWIGAGFAGGVALWWLATSANPFVIWLWNLRHNDRFYQGGRRSPLPWMLINPVELAIAAGLPIAVWCLIGAIAAPRRVPRAAWCALVVLLIANLSGRNLGEVARLWMIFLPALFTAAGVGPARLEAGRQAIFVTIVLTGVQTLGLQCLLQFVYPF